MKRQHSSKLAEIYTQAAFTVSEELKEKAKKSRSSKQMEKAVEILKRLNPEQLKVITGKDVKL